MSRKPSRIKSRSVIDWVVRGRDGVCLYGLLKQDGCYGPLDPHHIINVGAGGNDVEENLITLCRKHHDMAQAKRIPAEELRAILTRFHGYRY